VPERDCLRSTCYGSTTIWDTLNLWETVMADITRSATGTPSPSSRGTGDHTRLRSGIGQATVDGTEYHMALIEHRLASSIVSMQPFRYLLSVESILSSSTFALHYFAASPCLYSSKPSLAASCTVFSPAVMFLTVSRILDQSSKMVKGTFSLAQ
jgi:hypothetical protein